MRRAAPVRAAICLVMAAVASGSSESRLPSVSQRLVPEYRLKAVFLYNFAKFVEWPRGALGAETDPITLGVLDDTPFKGALDIVRSRTAQGRPFAVKVCHTLDETEGCDILFLNSTDTERVRAVLDKVRRRPVLTVGESEAFMDAGGIVRFYIETDRVRLEVNPEAARKSRLSLSAQLLEVARIRE